MIKTKMHLYYGLFFFLIQTLVLIRNYIIGFNYFYWFCDFAPLLLSIAFFINNKSLVKGIINLGLIPQIIFLVDFIYLTTLGMAPLGITLPILATNSFSILSTIFVHIATFMALIFTIKIKPDKKTLIYSIVFMFGVYISTLIFTSSSEYTNFVYSSGNLLNAFNFTIPYSVFLWPILAILLVILPTQGIQYVLYRIFRKKKLIGFK